jgi:hypothetical protein
MGWFRRRPRVAWLEPVARGDDVRRLGHRAARHPAARAATSGQETVTSAPASASGTTLEEWDAACEALACARTLSRCSAYQRRADATQAVAEHDRLINAHRGEVMTLNTQVTQLQRTVHLQRFDIETAHLPGIPSSLRAQLRSNGFETAADISERVREVHGIGDVRYHTLCDWRERMFSVVPP